MILEQARKEAVPDNLAKLTLTAMNAVTEEQEEPSVDNGRYRYPAVKKSVFKNVKCYRYRARPVTPKNYNPRPKSSNRYVFVGDDDELDMETEESEDHPDVEISAGDEEMAELEVEPEEEETAQQTEEEEAAGKTNVRYEINIFFVKETIEEAEAEEQEEVTEVEEDVPADNKTSNEEPEVVPEEVENEPEVVAEEVKKEPEVEAMKDTKPVTEKEISKPTAVKSVEDVDTKLGNWFNKEIRSMIHTTPKGWELRGAG